MIVMSTESNGHSLNEEQVVEEYSVTRRFDAFVDPEKASRWLFTTSPSKTECRLDTRVGGSYTITRRGGCKHFVAVGD
jgi:uncharacterized protein YndB with AHSA1/START domain